MTKIKQYAVEAFNAQLEIIKQDTTAAVTIVVFHEEFSVETYTDVSQAQKLTAAQLQTAGRTAIFDSIGCILDAYRHEVNNDLVVITDGEDNESDYKEAADNKKLVESLKSTQGWTVNYVALTNAKVGTKSTSQSSSLVKSRIQKQKKKQVKNAKDQGFANEEITHVDLAKLPARCQKGKGKKGKGKKGKGKKSKKGKKSQAEIKKCKKLMSKIVEQNKKRVKQAFKKSVMPSLVKSVLGNKSSNSMVVGETGCVNQPYAVSMKQQRSRNKKHVSKCLRWSTLKHVKLIKTKGELLKSWTHNYCRNPDNDKKGAWCYTDDTEEGGNFEYCEKRHGFTGMKKNTACKD